MLIHICSDINDANIYISDKKKNFYLHYSEKEKKNITLGMILNCINIHKKKYIGYKLDNLIIKKVGAYNNMSLVDYISNSIMTPGYQCFNYGCIYIPIS